MANSTFIFRLARVEGKKGAKAKSVDMTGREPQQLTLGEYYNTRNDKRVAGARLHYGQHNFLKGLFYIYKFSDGSFTDSFNAQKGLEMHVDISINYNFEDVANLVAQLKGMEDTVINPPLDDNRCSALMSDYQLHIEVKDEAVAQVSEYFARKNGEVNRLTVRIDRKDIVSFRIVHSSDEAFKASVGGTSVKLDTLMEGLFGKYGSESNSLSTVEEVRDRFCKQSSSKKRRNRRQGKDKSNSTPSAPNEVVTETTKAKSKPVPTIVVEEEETEDVPL